MRKITIVALIACLPSLAVAQQQTLPSNTVLGRLGTSPGPAQAIPFATLGNVLGVSQNIGAHKIAVGGATTLTGIGPLTTGQLLVGVTGSDPAACTNCSLAGVMTFTGGVSGATPTPQINLGNYSDSGGNPSISHIELFSGYGFGVSAFTLNYISGRDHKFYASTDLTNPMMTITTANTAATSSSTGTMIVNGTGGLGVGGAIFSGGSVRAGGAVAASGTYSTAVTNTAVMQNAGTGNSELLSFGPNASTNGQWNFYTVRSDGSNPLLSMVIASTGLVQFTQSIALVGSSSGQVAITVPAAASGTWALPAATDTFVGKATTDTFTNKTLDTAGAGNVFKINGTTITSISGNVAKVATATGALTSGDCVALDANGNFIAAGGPCTTGGGGGTVNAGTAGQMAYYGTSAAVVSGNPNANISAGALTLGIAGSVTGSLKLSGVTSGVTTLAVSAVTDGTLFFPAVPAPDTIVARNTTDTLTNKTINGASNTLTVLGASQISGTIPVGNLGIATDSNIWSATADVLVTAAHLNAAGAIVALSDAASIATDMATGINFSVTLGGNRTLGAPTNTQAGRSGCYFFTQDGSGTRTLVYNAVWKFANGTAPTLSTTAGAVDMLCYVVKDSTHIIGNLTAKVQ